MEDTLRKKQRKILVKKIQVYLSEKLDRMTQDEQWTKSEIAIQYGIPISRQSEMKSPDKYPDRGLNEKLLSKAITGGLLTVNEIKANVDLTPAEQSHVDTLAVLEEAGKIRKAGYDPAAILIEWQKKKGLLK
jgi:hypothetical protein